MNRKTLAIILLNWNGWEDTIECLESLFAGTWQDFSVILIDNGSEDDSILKIETWALNRVAFKSIDLTEIESGVQDDNSRVILIKSMENHGFARGCNIGIRYAIKRDYTRVFLLNNDTIIRTDCLEQLSVFKNEHPEYPVLTPLINYYNNRDIVWCLGGKLTFSGRRYFNYGDQHMNKIREMYKQVTFVSGCALYADSEVFKQYGLLTEKFFFGEEDYHFSQLMHNNRVKMAAVANALVYHKICRSNVKVFNRNRLPYKLIGYLNRFIDKKLFCRSQMYWKFWRMINLSYIIPKLVFREGYNLKEILHFTKLLVRFSSELSEVNKDFFFNIGALVIKK